MFSVSKPNGETTEKKNRKEIPMSIRKVVPVKPARKPEEKKNQHPKPAHKKCKKHQRRRPIGG